MIINPGTLCLWNVELRKEAGKFPHPNPNIANGKKNEPAIFESIPQFKSDCLSFIYDNFDNFVVDMLRDNVIDVLIPKHIDRIKVELSQYGLDEADSPELIILRKYISKPPSYGVVLSWLHSMDFKRDTAKKCFYVDGHENPEQKEHRSYFTKHYLTELEPRCFRWISVSVDELATLNERLGEGKEILPKP